MKGVLTARVEFEVRLAVEELAEANGLTLSAQVEALLREALGPDPVRGARIARLARMNREDGLSEGAALRAAAREVDADVTRKRVTELIGDGVPIHLAVRRAASEACLSGG